MCPNTPLTSHYRPKNATKFWPQSTKPQIQGLTSLFDELLGDLGVGQKYHHSINKAADVLLRRLHSRVETAELKGIAEITGISMYLLVSFNVVLDLLMGCTSGAIKSVEPDQTIHQAKILHFRTLDWGMLS